MKLLKISLIMFMGASLSCKGAAAAAQPTGTNDAEFAHFLEALDQDSETATAYWRDKMHTTLPGRDARLTDDIPFQGRILHELARQSSKIRESLTGSSSLIVKHHSVAPLLHDYVKQSQAIREALIISKGRLGGRPPQEERRISTMLAKASNTAHQIENWIYSLHQTADTAQAKIATWETEIPKVARIPREWHVSITSALNNPFVADALKQRLTTLLDYFGRNFLPQWILERSSDDPDAPLVQFSYRAPRLAPTTAVPADWECAICMDGNDGREIGQTRCGHTFHTDCIMANFAQGTGARGCPLCRASLTEPYDPLPAAMAQES